MIEFTKEQKFLLEELASFMIYYNKQINLTTITEPQEIWEKHFIDSAYPLMLPSISIRSILEVNASCSDVPRRKLPVETLVPEASQQEPRVIDIGTGAGFPGVVWKIFRPDLNITLLDSLHKRIYYLELLKEELNLDYTTIHARSEELALNTDYRERFDIAVSRAVANLPALCEYCLPFVKFGGIMLAMKGKNAEDEVKSAGNALKLLGGEIKEIINYKLPSGDKRSLVIIEKIMKTPLNYPRQRVNIVKNPL